MQGTETKHGLRVEGLSHAYGNNLVVDDVSLEVGTREILCLLGPSGCGKSTLLRVCAGLETLQSGRVVLNDRVLADQSGTDVPPEKRETSLLFQDFALFPHLTAMDNVMFGLQDLAPDQRKMRAEEVLDQVGMLHYADTFPHLLSGGEQQRIALARARAPRPSLMLLDEPFSNLDTRLRHQLRDLVLHVVKKSVAATLIVTHDPEEAMFLADRIAVMSEGRIVQTGTPEDLYYRPANSFVAGLFSEINRLEGEVVDGHVHTPVGRVCAPAAEEGSHVEVLVRPEYFAVGDGDGSGNGTVLASRLLGRTSLLHLSVPSKETDRDDLHLHIRISGPTRPREGDRIPVRVDPEAAFVFPLKDGRDA